MAFPPKEDGVATKILNEAILSATKVYDEAIAPQLKALKEYEEADAQARKVRDEAFDLAYEAFRKSREPFIKYYEDKIASALNMTVEEYREAIKEAEGR